MPLCVTNGVVSFHVSLRPVIASPNNMRDIERAQNTKNVLQVCQTHFYENGY